MLLGLGIREGFLEEGKFKQGLEGMGGSSSVEKARKGTPGRGAPSMKACSSRTAGVGSRNCKLVPVAGWEALVGKWRVTRPQLPSGKGLRALLFFGEVECLPARIPILRSEDRLNQQVSQNHEPRTLHWAHTDGQIGPVLPRVMLSYVPASEEQLWSCSGIG